MAMAKAEQESAFRKYLKASAELMASGAATDELTYHRTMGTLLEEIGESLSTSFICVDEGLTRDGNRPDFQLRDKAQVQGSLPNYGVVEVKGHDQDISNPFNLDSADGQQMWNYLEEFQLLTVTNYREFRLYKKGSSGNPDLLEVLTIADNKEDFRRLATKPKGPAEKYAPKITQFLSDIFRETESVTISDPKDIAAHLAMHARRALRILSTEGNGDLQLLRDSLEKSLDIKFANKKQKRLFLSMLVQTLFYGIFLAWVKDGEGKEFNWESSKRQIKIPVIRTLFEQLTTSSNLEDFGIEKILIGAVETLNRVDRSLFFKKFKEKNAIQHFYEDFLAEMDPEMRTDYGVWYTPPEVVKYMVERVDMVLRTELNCADGLADRRVYVLDPCCGTGAYILEVLRKINQIHEEKNSGSAVAYEAVKEAAMKRVFGFEIMAAPLVIANWQVSDYIESLDINRRAEGGGVFIVRKRGHPSILQTL